MDLVEHRLHERDVLDDTDPHTRRPVEHHAGRRASGGRPHDGAADRAERAHHDEGDDEPLQPAIARPHGRCPGGGGVEASSTTPTTISVAPATRGERYRSRRSTEPRMVPKTMAIS